MYTRNRPKRGRGAADGGAPASFSMADLAGMEFGLRAGPDYDFTDATKTTPAADTDPVYVLDDESANGRDGTQSTISLQPILRDRSGTWRVECDPSDDLVNIPTIASGGSLAAHYFVFRGNSGGGQRLGVITGNADDNNSFLDFGGSMYIAVGTTTRRGPINPGVDWTTGQHTLEVIGKAGSLKIYVDGVEVYTSASNTLPTFANPITLGALGGGGSSLNICACYLYSAEPTPQQRSDVLAYLAAEYP